MPIYISTSTSIRSRFFFYFGNALQVKAQVAAQTALLQSQLESLMQKLAAETEERYPSVPRLHLQLLTAVRAGRSLS